MRDGVREQLRSKNTISANNSSHYKVMGLRNRTSGWAAFGQQERQGLKKTEFDSDPYPPVENTLPLKQVLMNGSAKSFSSVVRASLLSPNVEFEERILAAGSSSKPGNEGVTIIEKLKELHKWADDSLIGDVLAAVNNDFSHTSSVLQTMFSSDSSNQTGTPYLSGTSDQLQEKAEETNFLVEQCLGKQRIEPSPEEYSTKSNLYAPVSLISGQVLTAPVEPEWQEDDIYLSLRKDAIRATRSAAQHSRAASNAFLRGDHYSAQELSRKAHAEWMAAERLNYKAAQEILSIRNHKNDVWKLDLHGLHASEAVHALKERLWRIETQFPLTVHPNKVVKQKACPPIDSVSCLSVAVQTEKEEGITSQRPGVLQVITGTGNHSRGGQAAIPMAVRGFLIENGYRIDDTRPGVIAVRPKFRDYRKF
ncbi:hypothetical protein MKW98_019433 [Papaver atlanticum]|uniref:Smr domain-containing protein n=1 Tax=Papaver atlanticum TaxID=357466 RepID=A0AAD4SA15_9MAGN|nr:hypothetical protein MKW98_019433 [Papaver atlanticum]